MLFNDKTKIVEILESESNQQRSDDKFNRVDIKAKNSKGEIIIVEVQNTRELYYLERILYGTAKAITEHISLGETYQEVKKVYSISILYFDLGKGNDYLYHGQNRFIGVHTNDELMITAKEEGITAKIIIGGAVITQEYADEIGADGYSKDAADAVKLAKSLM